MTAPTARPTLVWFRRDLRLADNAALTWAAQRGAPVIAVYVHAPDEDGDHAPGAASHVWLHHALVALGKDLAGHGVTLRIAAGPTVKALEDLVAETGASAVAWNRLYEPLPARRDARIEATLVARGVDVHIGEGMLLADPQTFRNKQGQPYRVFTPFWKALAAAGAPPTPKPVPKGLDGTGSPAQSDSPDALGLLPTLPWGESMMSHWSVGEAGAHARLATFSDGPVNRYATGRDRPDIDGVSRMSPYLHFGHVSPAQVWHTVGDLEATEPYRRQLGWREFGHHLLMHYPGTPTEPLNPAFANFPWWTENAEMERAWQRGETGYPLVDAGMRELWATGWMHNRVRMNVGSLLVKHLLGHWHIGERWFRDTLVDFDLANNTMGWQWIGGCGADAAPYFRIFNPVAQGERFDPEGEYIRRWVPELREMPSTHIHAPWEAPGNVLRAAGVALEENYPEPVIEHKAGRERALAAFQTTKERPG